MWALLKLKFNEKFQQWFHWKIAYSFFGTFVDLWFQYTSCYYARRSVLRVHTYAYTNIRASRWEHTRESHMRWYACACVCTLWKYIRCSVSGRFEAIAIYRLQSGSRPGRISSFIGEAWEFNLGEKKFYVPLLRSISIRATYRIHRVCMYSSRHNTLGHCCTVHVPQNV